MSENFVDRFKQFSQPLGHWYSGASYRLHGNVLATLFMDYSEYFAMQQAIQESEERHKTLFENMKQGVVYHDSTGACNDSCQCFGTENPRVDHGPIAWEDSHAPAMEICPR